MVARIVFGTSTQFVPFALPAEVKSLDEKKVQKHTQHNLKEHFH